MKTPNSLEEQMRSWTPRQPSAQLEKRIFAEGEHTRESVTLDRPRRTLALPWYQTLGASVAGFVVVLLMVLNFTHLSAIQHVSTPFGPMSNHMSSLAMATAPRNTWTAPILGWTNDGTVGSSIRPFDLLNTNRILR
jgi:hypothetical protein